MKHLTVPLGENCSLDGGPFFAVVGHGMSGDGERVVGEDAEGNVATFSLGTIEEDVQDEMEVGEPVTIKTGDVGDGYTVGTIRVPLMAGFYVELEGTGGESYLLPNLTNYQRRQAVERRLRTHGGHVAPSGQ